MDAVHFGRWVAERRRACGYRSQRTLVATTHSMPVPGNVSEGISEDFLGRLEAGQLAHPFRGSARRRVLALAWYLCQTPREVKAYLRAAEVAEMNAHETAFIQLLQQRLAPQLSSPLLLPPRPAHLIGRSTELCELVGALCTTETGLYVVTGMPGVGKSALACEACHELASDQYERVRRFPDGIAAFTCTDRKGDSGLSSLLHDVVTAFHSSSARQSLAGQPDVPGEKAALIDHSRMALAGKRILLLLDDLEVDFPLRQALDALLGSGLHGVVVLATSRFVPAPALMRYHLHLEPLTPEAALALFAALLDRSLQEEEQQYVEQICEAVGYLPLAIEVAAAAVAVGGVAPALLALSLRENPLDPLLDCGDELRLKLNEALETLDPELRKQFALLSTLGTRSFGLASAAALQTSSVENGTVAHMASLSRTAANLQKFVRRSLLDLEEPGNDLALSSSLPALNPVLASRVNHQSVRYRMHPLFYAQARLSLNELDADSIAVSTRKRQAYALSYLAHYKEELPLLRRERDFLLASVQQAISLEDYQQALQLIEGLMPVCHLYRHNESEQLFRWGLLASEELHDRSRRAKFLFYLAALYCMRGDLTRSRQALQENLALAESLRYASYTWTSLAELAHIAHIQGEYDAALRFSADYLQYAQDRGDLTYIAEARHLHGFYSRLQGKREIAYEDIQSGIAILAEADVEKTCTHTYLLDLQLQAELARICGDYAGSREYVETAASIVREERGEYSYADILYDQACFAYEQGKYVDAEQLARRVMQVARACEAPHFYTRSLHILQRLPAPLHER